MHTTLFLINDDAPKQFPARVLKVLREDVRLNGQPGIVVRVEPPIEHAAGGPLATALLVPRHRHVNVDDLSGGTLARPACVFVCRFDGDAEGLPNELGRDDVSIVFWGLVNTSFDFRR